MLIHNTKNDKKMTSDELINQVITETMVLSSIGFREEDIKNILLRNKCIIKGDGMLISLIKLGYTVAKQKDNGMYSISIGRGKTNG